MNQIKCPHCDKSFTMDEAGYADILKQVRDKEFEKTLHERLELAEQSKKTEIALAEAKLTQGLQAETSKKDAEIAKLKADFSAVETAQKLAIKEAVGTIEKERDELKSNLKHAELEKQISEKALEDKYQTQIKDRDDAIERLRELKAKLSTKMVGETLELHCENSFNMIRSTSFPKAYFEKDNDSKTGSKGDYIFRDLDDDKNEIVSIMFEMKNENDTTATKKKNIDFLKELDKDRNEKGCEYAVLVSLLEEDSELYNGGIVDYSHLYPKMYVVRPQFFIPMISLLKNAGLNSLQYKSELALVKAQNIDVTNFEKDLEDVKVSFGKNYDLASRKFEDSIKEIDKAIAILEKAKANLKGSENNLRILTNKLQEVSVKTLTKGNPTMAQKFKELPGA